MRFVEAVPEGLERTLRRTPERDQRLAAWLTSELNDAYAARLQWDQDVQEDLRQYEGVPRNPMRNVPVENAPNIEVTLGAIACDALYAQATDLIWTISPTVTVRPVHGDEASVQLSKDFQAWIDWGVRNEWKVREAFDHAVLDDIQLGTGIYSVPWLQSVKKTDLHRVTDVGPRVLALPVEDFVIEGGAGADPQTARWVAMRYWLTEAELALRAKKYKWKTDGVQLCGTKGWIRTRREQLGRTHTNKISTLYEVHDAYCAFDYDEDGLDEDLFVQFDRHGLAILKLSYTPYDTRPTEVMRYQLRGHLFYGLGVLRMIRPYQEEVTEGHNDRTLNVKLANTRMWRTRPGVVPGGTMLVWPNRVLETSDPDGIAELKLSEVYPSAFQNESITVALAERRVGSAEIAAPRPSALLGGRTPGITALSILQQANRRFTPAFDAIRFATAGAIRQCVERYREQLLAGNAQAAQNIRRVMGADAARRIIGALMQPHFEDAVVIELTASSVSVNREADRQNAILLTQMLSQYYDKALALMQIASQQGLAEPVRETARKIAERTGEMIERTLRTFDAVRDPQRFVLDLESEIDQLPLPQQGVEGLAQVIQSLVGGGPEAPNGQLDEQAPGLLQ